MITAKVKGIPELSMKLRAMQAEVKSLLKEASLAAAEPIHDEAELLAPRSAEPKSIGHLADHIEIEVKKSTASACLVHVGPDPQHWYGKFPELGTAHQGAQPYLRPAVDTKDKAALKAFSDVMRRKIIGRGLIP